eukprot:CAMPEP_0182541296 /NCGR_PEP_ID=MMETSP1323-20130603/28427_1 /TAXON_ID=236787 /ORGANISM="Florenciella parvula, Strain RCC1693" /LENGTH=77 /DNA_ID=CAMNT_0024752045 /DNA_START=122 /DNA_END=352 /DNA_ORIENTATION=-
MAALVTNLSQHIPDGTQLQAAHAAIWAPVHAFYMAQQGGAGAAATQSATKDATGAMAMLAAHLPAGDGVDPRMRRPG